VFASVRSPAMIRPELHAYEGYNGTNCLDTARAGILMDVGYERGQRNLPTGIKSLWLHRREQVSPAVFASYGLNHAFYHNVHHHGHWTAAAYGCLKPPLQGGSEGTHPHLSHGMTLFASS
jgi:hypothetical protein